MKDLKSFFGFACLVLLTFVTIGISTAAPYEIQFKSGTITPSAGVFDIPQAAFLATQNNQVHVLLQLEDYLQRGDRQLLENAGIKLLSYFPDRAYAASIPRDFDVKTFSKFGVRSIGPLLVDYKLNPRVVERRFGPWSEYTSGRRIFAFEIMPDVSLEDASDLLKMQDCEIGDFLESAHTLLVAVEPERVASVAAADFVLFIDETPPPVQQLNSTVRTRLHVNEVQAAPYNLSGQGVTLMVYDGGMIDSTHPDFGDRVTWLETHAIADHPTHVAGTVGGDGTQSTGTYRGMATQVRIISGQYDACVPYCLYESPNDFEPDYTLARSTFNIEATTNSIGANISPNGYDCSWMGDYESTSRLLDQMTRNTVNGPLIMFFAAGNERNDQGCDLTQYRCMSVPAGAKNIITVGATSSTDATASFSSWGPTDDGRLKPEVSATGVNVNSCAPGPGYGYQTMSGTSMATPATAGVGALILEQWHQLFAGSPDPLPETMKAILINSTNDIGPTGPDYQTGFGLVNAQRAIDNVRAYGVLESSLEVGESFSHSFAVTSGTTVLDVSIAWSDPPASGNVTPTLVNNLDLTLEAPGGVTYRPWVLNPDNPGAVATTGTDSINVCERVHVQNPVAGQWTIHVTGTLNEGESQTFGISANVALVEGWVSLSGQIRNSANGQGIAGRINVVGGSQAVLTDATGNYLITLPGNETYNIQALAFGFVPVVIPVTLTSGPVTQNFDLNSAANGVITGVVRNQFNTNLGNAIIHLDFPNAEIPDDTANQSGNYSVSLPGANEYTVTADYLGMRTSVTITVPENGTVSHDFLITDPRFEPAGPDSYGYFAYEIADQGLTAAYDWLEISPQAGGLGTPLTGTGNDWVATVNVPFTVRYYGQQTTSIRVSADGWVGLTTTDNGTRPYANAGIPTADAPNGMVCVFWDDLWPQNAQGGGGDISYYYDQADNRFIIEYHNVSHYNPTTNHVTGQLVIYDITARPTLTNDNELLLQWQQIDYSDHSTTDDDATIGIESPNGDDGIQIVYNGAYNSRCFEIQAGTAIRFTTGTTTGYGTVQGQLTLVPMLQDMTQLTIAFGSYTTHPDASGAFQVQNVIANTYSLTVSHPGYESGQINNFIVQVDSTTNLNLTLYRLDPVRNLTGVFDRSVPEIRLAWNRPAWSEPMINSKGRNPHALDALTGYEIWLGGTGVVSTVTDTFYTYHVSSSRSFNFWIKAIYAGGIADTSNHFRITVDLAANPLQSTIPTVFYVEQNYPNPFNPKTLIRYGLPKNSDVKIEVYNIIGQKVEVLAQGQQEPGNYSIKFNAANLDYGIYYYRMEAGEFTQMRKMLLLR